MHADEKRFTEKTRWEMAYWEYTGLEPGTWSSPAYGYPPGYPPNYPPDYLHN